MPWLRQATGYLGVGFTVRKKDLMSIARIEYFQNHPWQLATGNFLLFSVCFLLFLSGLGKVIIISINPQQTTGNIFSVEQIRTKTFRYFYEVKNMSLKGSVQQTDAESYHLGDRIEVSYSRFFPTLSVPNKSIPSLIFSGTIFLVLSVFFLLIVYIRSDKSNSFTKEEIRNNSLVL